MRSRPCRPPGAAGQPAGVLQDAPKQELDLAVQAPQIVARPALQRREDRGIQPQKIGLSLRHGTLQFYG
jgi:hypothetical protein